MRSYETVVVLRASLTQEELQAEVAKLEKLLEGNGAKEMRVENVGRRDLASMIKKQSHGQYIHFHYQSDQHSVVENANTNLRINDNVVIFQTHRVNKPTRKFQGNPKRVAAAAQGATFDSLYESDDDVMY